MVVYLDDERCLQSPIIVDPVGRRSIQDERQRFLNERSRDFIVAADDIIFIFTGYFDGLFRKILLKKTRQSQGREHGIAIRPLVPEYRDLIVF